MKAKWTRMKEDGRLARNTIPICLFASWLGRARRIAGQTALDTIVNAIDSFSFQ